MQSLADIAPKAERATRQDTCEHHGAFESINYVGRIWSRCPKCAEALAELRKKREEEEERERQQKAWEHRLRRSCIPERFLDRTLKNFKAETPEQQRALAFANAYADDFDNVMKTGRCALFIGSPGTGKTHLAAGIALRLMHRDKRIVLFTTVMRAIRGIKDTWTKGSETTESQAIEALVYPELLILDEVGVQFGSETEKLMLFDVLNERYEKRKPCLLLSNLSIDDVKAFLGERVFDRLREDGGEAVAFDWESYRGRASEAS
jgi:DNA replication protein DnaC